VNVYAGTIRHRRFAVRAHAFRHRIALAYFDAGAPPSGGRFVRYRRSDYLGDPAVPLDAAVRALVRARTGETVDGPVRLLAALRSFGHCFNPIALYYCFDAGDRLRFVVAEVTNTPWGERHAYVMPAGGADLEKVLHVSPFMGMDHVYTLRAGVPGRALSVHLESRRAGRLAFDATLALRRRPFSVRPLLGASLRTLVLIYAHALALKVKGLPVHAHPEAA
jgi:uncharacterized protein